MQHYIRKYFWTVGVISVVVCSFLAAKGANSLVEGKYLSDSATPERAKVRRPGHRTAATQRSKTGEPMAKRNMFCAECAPEEPSVAVANPADPNAVPYTSLPLELIATIVAQNEKYSFATVRNTSTNTQGAYYFDTSIPGAGKIVAITSDHLDYENEQTKRRERISLGGRAAAAAVAQAPPTPTTETTNTGEQKDEIATLIEQGIKMIDENNYEIDQSLRDKVLANPMAVATGARIVPSVKNGKPNGFKMYAIRPSSVYAKIGFRNGDTVQAINGYELSTPDKALEVYTKLKDASNLSVTITRRGEPVTLNYTIR